MGATAEVATWVDEDDEEDEDEEDEGALHRLTARLRGVTTTIGEGSVGEAAATRAAIAWC